ncbi:MBOAT family protein, partial [Neglectibacter timonensis]|nr:MBOAT family protein [Neglectibacter timonensis]MCQ4845508.1 MBOAT family protein [Neglectibacter timonensis]
MNFNSLSYLIFLVLNIVVYYLLPGRFRNLQLLAASYYFYMCWNPKYALLMLFSTAVTYFCSLFVQRSVWGKRRFWLVLSLLLNLAIL